VISTGTALGRTVAFGPKRTSGECLGAGRSTSNSVKAPLPQPMSIHRKPERGPASRGRYRPRAGSSFPSSARRRPRRRNGFDVRPSGVFFRGQVRRAHIAEGQVIFTTGQFVTVFLRHASFAPGSRRRAQSMPAASLE
jgi:hypothetical protein